VAELQIYTIIGNNIKELRKYKQITQKKLGEALDLKNTTICNYEKGKPIDIPTMKKIADYFDISYNNLLNNNVLDNIIKANLKMADTYNKYVGDYYLYYLNTVESTNEIIVTSLNISLNFKGESNQIQYLAKSNFNDIDYNGRFILYSDYYTISLNNQYKTDSVFILGLIPPPQLLKKLYNGGVTFVLSISRGRNKLPCFQKLIICKKQIDTTTYVDNLLDFLSIKELANITKLKEEDDNKFQNFLTSI